MTMTSVEVTCPECEDVITGYFGMVHHIRTKHTDYTPIQALDFAKEWTEDAYLKQERFLRDYHYQRKIDPSE